MTGQKLAVDSARSVLGVVKKWLAKLHAFLNLSDTFLRKLEQRLWRIVVEKRLTC
jgi:hypothetical protein